MKNDKADSEKTIDSLDACIRHIPGVTDISAKECPPLTLAFLGDCVFDLIIKTRVAGRGNRPVHFLHEETSRVVNAGAQSAMMRAIQPMLTEEEHAVYRRARNARTVTPAKNQSVTDYRRATGFEALIGYLYLNKEYGRLYELVSEGLAAQENAQEKEEECFEQIAEHGTE